MKEYIKLYNRITGQPDDIPLSASSEKESEIEFDDIFIPEDFEGSNLYSSTAKQAQKEISEYLLSVSSDEKLFYKLRERIYNGDLFSEDSFNSFAKDNSFDCI